MPRGKAPTTRTPPSRIHKRQSSSSATTREAITNPTGSRQSKRIKASTAKTPTSKGVTVPPKKSKYFEGSDSDDDRDEQELSQGDGQEEASDYDDGGASASHVSSPTPSSSDKESYYSDDATMKGRRKQVSKKQTGTASTKPQSTTAGVVEKGNELWRQGVKAGLGPGKAVFIERPRPRDDGGIKYVPERIHPNTMAFLKDLEANNEREWLKSE